MDHGQINRAQGCILGQLAGDSLGSLVEFRTADDIRLQYPDGVRELADGGHWGTIAGQPTDDSEMALSLARMLIDRGGYCADAALGAYRSWMDSVPFDCGLTVLLGLTGKANTESQANGALMRISPLGIYGAGQPLEKVGEWAIQDAALTHPHPNCQQANRLYAMAIAFAIRTPVSGPELYQQIVKWAEEGPCEDELMDWIHHAATEPPQAFSTHMGWVRIAFGNALWQLKHAANLEEGVVDTARRGGDSDTNAAIAGALLGAVYGREAVPEQWQNALQNCRPEKGKPGVEHARPPQFWPTDALELSLKLLKIGSRPLVAD